MLSVKKFETILKLRLEFEGKKEILTEKEIYSKHNIWRIGSFYSEKH